MKRRTQALIVLAVLTLAGLYLHGTFDRPLSSIGLNAHECARNGLGVTFCGTELTEYRERIARGKEEGEAAAQRIRTQARETEESIRRSTETGHP